MVEIAQIIKPGLLTTVQDLGRKGYQKEGIVVSGAMDAYSFQMANLLVGNDRNAPALEITYIGPVLKFLGDAQIAITGAKADVFLDGDEISLWKSHKIKKGQVLAFSPAIQGVRLYLAIGGGICVPKKLDSSSTYIAGKLGGYDGRKLEKGDILYRSKKWVPRLERFLGRDLIPEWKQEQIIRVIKGPEFHYFTEKSINDFFQFTYEITNQADRMGYRLHGKPLKRKDGKNMVSEAVTFGTVQVPDDGQPIVLMADRQTTGGYYRIANVISVDLPKLAQMAPFGKVKFAEISLEDAQRLWIEREKRLKSIEIGARLL